MNSKYLSLISILPVLLTSCNSKPVEVSASDFSNEVSALEEKVYTKATSNVTYKGVLPVFTVDANNNIKVDTITTDRELKFTYEDLSNIAVADEYNQEEYLSSLFVAFNAKAGEDVLKEQINVQYFVKPLSVKFEKQYIVHAESVNIDLFYYHYINLTFDEHGYVSYADVTSAITIDMSSIFNVEWLDFLENIKYMTTLNYSINHLE